MKSNEEIGRRLNALVNGCGAQANEYDKYKLLVEETDKITSLIFGLAGRLAKAENAFNASAEGEHAAAKVKMDKLAEQLDEAEKLKANIDKRSAAVVNMLCKYIKREDPFFVDFEAFLTEKSRLVMAQRDVQDKISTLEEQISILKC